MPVEFRCTDGRTNVSQTHIETWEALRAVAGRADFLYVADSKLCTRENMDYLDLHRGRFVTVLPRSRLEDREFRKWIQTHEPAWELVWDRPNPRRKGGPRDRWYVCRAPLSSREAWPVIWVWSPLLALHQEQSRRERLAAALEALGELRIWLASPKTRLRTAREVDRRIEQILASHTVGRYLEVRRTVREEHRFRQWRRGRPGPQTAYRKLTRRRWDVAWTLDEPVIAYDRKSDGMYPLLTNDRTLTPAQVLEAHKGPLTIEKRFEQIKTVHEIAPVFLKNEGRIEALFTLYFLGLLVQALIQRELRQAMQQQRIAESARLPSARANPMRSGLSRRRSWPRIGITLNRAPVRVKALAKLTRLTRRNPIRVARIRSWAPNGGGGCDEIAVPWPRMVIVSGIRSQATTAARLPVTA